MCAKFPNFGACYAHIVERGGGRSTRFSVAVAVFRVLTVGLVILIDGPAGVCPPAHLFVSVLEEAVVEVVVEQRGGGPFGLKAHTWL